MTRPLADPLQRARAAAERALRDRLEAAGWAEEWPFVLEATPVLAEIAADAVWPHAKRALRPRTEDRR